MAKKQSLWKMQVNVSSSGTKRCGYPSREKQREAKPLGSGLPVVNTSELLSLINIIKKLAAE